MLPRFPQWVIWNNTRGISKYELIASWKQTVGPIRNKHWSGGSVCGPWDRIACSRSFSPYCYKNIPKNLDVHGGNSVQSERLARRDTHYVAPSPGLCPGHDAAISRAQWWTDVRWAFTQTCLIGLTWAEGNVVWRKKENARETEESFSKCLFYRVYLPLYRQEF